MMNEEFYRLHNKKGESYQSTKNQDFILNIFQNVSRLKLFNHVENHKLKTKFTIDILFFLTSNAMIFYNFQWVKL